MKSVVYWDTDPPRKFRIRIEFTDNFDARGMQRVYGRGDHFWRRTAFNMDVWRDRNGRLLGRFWSRNPEVDWMSIEIHGIRPDSIPPRRKGALLSDAWIPKALRQAYENWVLSEF